MGLFGDRDLPDGAGDCPPIGQGYFNFTELAQDLLRAVSLSRHLFPLFRTRVSNIQTGSVFGGHVKLTYQATAEPAIFFVYSFVAVKINTRFAECPYNPTGFTMVQLHPIFEAAANNIL